MCVLAVAQGCLAPTTHQSFTPLSFHRLKCSLNRSSSLEKKKTNKKRPPGMCNVISDLQVNLLAALRSCLPHSTPLVWCLVPSMQQVLLFAFFCFFLVLFVFQSGSVEHGITKGQVCPMKIQRKLQIRSFFSPVRKKSVKIGEHLLANT